MKRAIVLCSGGLDSVVLTYYLRRIKKIEDIKLIFFDYNQSALKQELNCVSILSKKLKVELESIDIKWLSKFSTSLINKGVRKEELSNINPMEEASLWYVPGRNPLFLIIGMAMAEFELLSKQKNYDIYLGIKREGDIQFNDTTPEFLKNMNKIISSGIEKDGFKFLAPFLKKEKEDLILLANKLSIDLKETYSCYLNNGFVDNIPLHCGVCGGCKSRKKAFKFTNIKDSTLYEI